MNMALVHGGSCRIPNARTCIVSLTIETNDVLGLQFAAMLVPRKLKHVGVFSKFVFKCCRSSQIAFCYVLSHYLGATRAVLLQTPQIQRKALLANALVFPNLQHQNPMTMF